MAVARRLDALRPADGEDPDGSLALEDRLEERRDDRRRRGAHPPRLRVGPSIGHEERVTGHEHGRASCRLVGDVNADRIALEPGRRGHDEPVALPLDDRGSHSARDLERGVAHELPDVPGGRCLADDLRDPRHRPLALLELRRSLLCLASLYPDASHELLDRETDDERDAGPQDRAPPLRGSECIVLVDERREEEDGSGDRADGHLPAAERQGDPEHRQDRERRVARGRPSLRLAEEPDDHEVREGWKHVRVARKPRPGDGERAERDQRGERDRGYDEPALGRPGRDDDRRERKRAHRSEGEEAACDRALERTSRHEP